jgi:hypothetical protein
MVKSTKMEKDIKKNEPESVTKDYSILFVLHGTA